MKLLFIYKGLTTFVKNDIDILEKKYKVIQFEYKQTKLFELFKLCVETDFSYVWFGSDHALFTILFNKILRKKTIVVAGGYDAANVPEIGYGLMSHPVKRYVAKFVFNNADLTLALSRKTAKDVLKECKPKSMKLLYGGISTGKFYFKSSPQLKRSFVLTTTDGVSESTIWRKGLRSFVEVAKFFPNVIFFVVGEDKGDSLSELKNIASANVKFVGYVPNNRLFEYLEKSKVYCQLSRYESFSMAVAEAMACGCAPVITEHVAIKELIGDKAFYAKYDDITSIKDAIAKALRQNSKPDVYRRVIQEKAELKLREDRLLKIISQFANAE